MSVEWDEGARKKRLPEWQFVLASMSLLVAAGSLLVAALVAAKALGS